MLQLPVMSKVVYVHMALSHFSLRENVTCYFLILEHSKMWMNKSEFPTFQELLTSKPILLFCSWFSFVVRFSNETGEQQCQNDHLSITMTIKVNNESLPNLNSASS